MNNYLKILCVLIFSLIVIATGFIFTVSEGTGTIVSRFGRIHRVQTVAGLYFRLPWPIDTLIVYDTRQQYLDSGHIETLTHDMINVILQSYVVWEIEDMARFHMSVGDDALMHRHLNDLIANTKHGVLGHFEFNQLISTDPTALRLEEINQAIEAIVHDSALANFGVSINALRLKRIALPHENIQSIFTQMTADRQRYVSQYLAEGERDAAIIASSANAQAAEIVAAGMIEAAEIEAQTQRLVAEIFGEAYGRNPELFVLLQNLMALENTLHPDIHFVLQGNDSPFDLLMGQLSLGLGSGGVHD